MDTVLRYLAVSVMIVHLDNYIGMGHNYYLYLNEGKFTLIPWDLNMVFGGFDRGVTQNNIADFYIDKPTTTALSERPLIGRLMGHPPYVVRYHRYLKNMLEGCFKSGPLETRIEDIATLINPYVQKDPTKFFTSAQFEQSISSDPSQAKPIQKQSDNRRRGPGGPDRMFANAPSLKT